MGQLTINGLYLARDLSQRQPFDCGYLWKMRGPRGGDCGWRWAAPPYRRLTAGEFYNLSVRRVVEVRDGVLIECGKREQEIA